MTQHEVRMGFSPDRPYHPCDGPSPQPARRSQQPLLATARHQPGALALALTELGLRGANLTRIESRPSDEAWRYRFFVDLRHAPGQAGLDEVFVPPLVTVTDIRFLGSYKAVR